MDIWQRHIATAIAAAREAAVEVDPKWVETAQEILSLAKAEADVAGDERITQDHYLRIIRISKAAGMAISATKIWFARPELRDHAVAAEATAQVLSDATAKFEAAPSRQSTGALASLIGRSIQKALASAKAIESEAGQERIAASLDGLGQEALAIANAYHPTVRIAAINSRIVRDLVGTIEGLWALYPQYCFDAVIAIGAERAAATGQAPQDRRGMIFVSALLTRLMKGLLQAGEIEEGLAQMLQRLLDMVTGFAPALPEAGYEKQRPPEPAMEEAPSPALQVEMAEVAELLPALAMEAEEIRPAVNVGQAMPANYWNLLRCVVRAHPDLERRCQRLRGEAWRGPESLIAFLEEQGLAGFVRTARAMVALDA